jgi:choline kinase
MSADLMIVAAGIGSRMSSKVPKALVPITDEPCLTTTLQQIGHKFGRVYVVTNILAQDAWDTYFHNHKYPELLRNLVNIPIHSGMGDGHAVYSAIKVLNARGSFLPELVIAWGDVFFTEAEIIDEMMALPMISGILPAVFENNPYVALIPDSKMNCKSAEFSKHGEINDNGYHDQSVFRFETSVLYNALQHLDRGLWKNGKYITPGNELSLLHTFHYLYNAGYPAQIHKTKYSTRSFNTIQEVQVIQQEIDLKWKDKFRPQSS